MTDGSPIPSLSAGKLRRMLQRLKFQQPLEAEFRRDYEAGALMPRIGLQIIGIVLIAATPLYDSSLLHAPEAFLRASRILQFAVQIPFVLLALGVTAWAPLRRYSAPATLLAVVVVACGLATQRMIGEPLGFIVPQDFPAITFTAMMFLGRLRLYYTLPIASLTLIGTTALDLRSFNSGSALYGDLSAWILFMLSATGAYTLEYWARQSWYRGRLLQFQASCDALTGLPNRRHFDAKLRELLRDAARYRKNLALLMIDIDHFKAFNDHFGHPRGDECLRRIGIRLNLAMRRPHDFCARIGGEEFAAVWFDVNAADAPRLAEDLRLAIEALSIPPAPGYGAVVTGSGGFVQLTAPSPAVSTERVCADLIRAADSALYEAKRAGRARLVVAE